MTDLKTLPFSHGKGHYDKLDHPVFMTIRRRDKFGNVGEMVEVKVGEKGDREIAGIARIIAKEEVTFGSLNPHLLGYDTQLVVQKTGSIKDRALRKINGFYRNPVGWNEPLTMYWLQWVADDD